jgi:hypothetical protein
MTTVTYTIPDDPPDPETAALELIVRLPQLLNTDAFTQVLQAYYGLLHLEGAFTGLPWADAKQIAAAISFDVMTRDDPAAVLRSRVDDVLAGRYGMSWKNPERAVRALNIAATALGL